jgi:hypothetical protein
LTITSTSGHNLVNMYRSMKSMRIPCTLKPLAQSQQNPLTTHKADIGSIAWPLVKFDRRRWTPLPMPSNVIERIAILAKASQSGMNYTDMRNEIYDDNEDDDSEADSDTDSEYTSDDASSVDDDDADDDYDDFIAGVDMDNMDNPDNSDPDAEEADENINDGLSAGQDEDEALDDVSLSEENVKKDVPTRLKTLTDDTGALPPIIQFRTRKQAKETDESLMTGAEPIKTVTKKQQKFRK